MFKNFQEHFERSEESRFRSEFLGFNPKHERIKLLLSAILIPVGCSFFYFLHTGHKYADLGIAIGNIETPVIDIDQELMSATNKLDFTENNSLLPSNTTIVFDGENEDENNTAGNSAPIMSAIMSFKSDIGKLTDEALAGSSGTVLTISEKTLPGPNQINQIPGKNLKELTELLITNSKQNNTASKEHLNAGRSQAEIALLITGNDHDADKDKSLINGDNGLTVGEKTSDDKIDHDIEIIAASQFTDSPADADNIIKPEKTKRFNPDGDAVKAPTATNENLTDMHNTVAMVALDNADHESVPANIASSANSQSLETTSKQINKSEIGLSEEESRIILVDKIIGLLKSEVINPHSTADTGKRSIINRHSHPIKKTFDVNKLESLLEDI